MLRLTFRPEFLNRIDDTVVFKPLRLEELERIVDLLIADLRRRLDERHIGLELSAEARAYVARRGFDPVFGARPLKRYLQHELETRIGRALIAGEVVEGARICVVVADDALAVRIEDPSREPADVSA